MKNVRTSVFASLSAVVIATLSTSCAVQRMEQQAIPAWERPIEIPTPIVRKKLKPKSPLHLAVETRNETAAIKAINAGMEINLQGNDGYYPLHWASWHNSKSIVELLLAKGANPNVRTFEGQTPLHLAATHKNKEIVDMLLASPKFDKKGANAVDKQGYTPLFEVALMGHVEVAEALIDAGADINHGEPHHHINVLHNAAKAGQLEMVQLLVVKGAELDRPDDGGWTALYYASVYGHAAVVRHLVQQAANVFLKDELYGRSPLHQATIGKHLETVKALVEGGVDVNAKANDGVTALDIAATRYKKKARAPQIQHYLQKHGATRTNGSGL